MNHTLIHNGRLIDGTGREPIPDGAVLLKDNRILAAGRLGEIPIPAGAINRVDAGGGAILPGMIDTHVHIMLVFSGLEARMTTPFSLKFFKAIGHMKDTLDAGITTVRDAGGADAGVKQAVEQGLVDGPRLQISITALSITGGHGDSWQLSGHDTPLFSTYPGMPNNVCDGVDGVRKKVREVLRAGAEVVKICSTGGVLSPTDHPAFTQFSMDELRAIVEEARFRRGVKVMSHAQGTEGIKNAVLAGIHSIEHGIFLDDEGIELMLERGTFLVPTLMAGIALLEIAEKTGIMPAYAVAKAREVVEIHGENISRAHKAGVRIAMGTDAGVFPHGQNLRELGLMTDIGMTPMEAIVATTRVAAECLGWEDRIGTLEPGKLGDLIVTAVDPLADIRGLAQPDNIKVVVKDGRIVKDIRRSE